MEPVSVERLAGFTLTLGRTDFEVHWLVGDTRESALIAREAEIYLDGNPLTPFTALDLFMLQARELRAVLHPSGGRYNVCRKAEFFTIEE